MQKLFVSLLALGLMAGSANAQTKALETAKISTPSVQCDMCKTRIEQYLKRIDGVTFVNVGVRNKVTTVKYLTDRTNIEMIKTSIANAGYDVAKSSDDVEKKGEIEIAANPDSYKLLPKCCKKPEDGGGMPKH
ncbi:heavy-metal-associated domain-containing protein [Flavisolibacter nicotianae]|uniref:heavy-metal-associated domain-containing protein n=1 Tax=Flavisolibacter nicotianae TaxID=2364882 RepID=UPI000EAB9A2D|nr:cation transporter [Flavisolibacter nicotianae]